MLDLTIGFLTCRSRDLLDQALGSCYSSTKSISFEIVVVDNASGDGTIEMVQEKYPDVRVIANEQNVGVAPARNQLIRAARGRYLAFLDVDTLVLPGAMETLVDVMNRNPDVGLSAPKLLYGDRSLQLSCRRFPGPMNVLIEGTFLSRYFPNSRLVRDVRMLDFDHNHIREVDCVYGAAMVIRLSGVEKIGMFDERYVFQYEDYDYCFKVRRAGMKVLYIPDAEIIHFYEREQKGIFHPRIHLHIRSILRYLRKDYYPHIWLRNPKNPSSQPDREIAAGSPER
jgi:GT2 family glycosyltransferase